MPVRILLAVLLSAILLGGVVLGISKDSTAMIVLAVIYLLAVTTGMIFKIKNFRK